jgi:predicted transposase YdaD
MKQDIVNNQDKTRTSWHPAFLEAIKLELDQYGDVLEYVPEYQLTKEPLRIDVVIVKKRKDVRIEKNIAAIFRKDNLIEYKSPTDYISIEDFYTVYAYACLYVTMKSKTTAGINDLTITFVGSRHPLKLAEHLEQVRHCVVEKSSPGVYSVKGDPIPMQIIDTRELPVEENLWLAQLDNRLDHAGARRIIRELDRENRAERMAAYIDAVYTANFEVMEEVSMMSDTTMVYGKTLENAGYVTRKMILAKMDGEIAGKEEKALEIARNALTQGIPLETVAIITGLDIEKIREIARQGTKPVK